MVEGEEVLSQIHSPEGKISEPLQCLELQCHIQALMPWHLTHKSCHESNNWHAA